MAESLQRSEISFRRQGSSGLIWDDKLLNGELLAAKSKPGGDAAAAEAAAAPLERSRSTGAHPYRAVKVPSPTADPPSPKVSGCGLCGMFAKPAHQPHKSNRRR